jgi:hypothetical protein
MTDKPYEWPPKSLAALRGSIAKWQAIVEGIGRDHGVMNCPLCEMFYDGKTNDEGFPQDCVGCPVYHQTGEDNCVGTPYEKWSRLSRLEMQSLTSGYWPKTPEQLMAAHAELKFLISLLPKGEVS